MVDREQNHGFDEPGLDDRSPDGDDRFVREDGSAFRNRPHIAGKPEILQIGEEVFTEQVPASQIGDVLRRKGKAAQILHHLLDPGHDRQASVIRNMPEEHVEVGDLIAESVLKKTVRLGQLIKIGEHGQIVRTVLRGIGAHDDRLLCILVIRVTEGPGRVRRLRPAWLSGPGRS